MISPNAMSLLVLAASGFVLALILVPVARTAARRVGLVDRPDGRRKLHGHPTPVAGGPALLVSCAIVLSVALLVPHPLADALAEHGSLLLGLLLGATAIVGVGVADDAVSLRGRHKLLGQVAAVGLVVSFGVRVESITLFDYRIELGLLAVPFTVFWLLGAINSLNLLDGMDGLLGSVGAILCLALAALAAAMNNWPAACVAAVLGGALIGFLRYNLPPATVFLGDSGSMLVGLVVGVLAIQSSLKGPATAALAAPLALLVLPVFDTTAAIIRRKLTGRSLYVSDRGHLHHCLQRSGLSNRRILLVISGLSLVTVAGALVSMAYQNEGLALLSGLLVVAVLITTRLFGYAEYLLLQRYAVGLARSFLSPRQARHAEVHIQGSADWNTSWARLTECAERLNLSRLSLDVNAPLIQEGYHAHWQRADHDADHPGHWRAEIPLAAGGQTVGRLEIVGPPEEQQAVWAKVAELAAVVAEISAAVTDLTPLPSRPAEPERAPTP